MKFLGIYALINFASAFANFFRMVLLVLIGLRASKALFEGLLCVVLRAQMSFFDTTPIGRIVNRFSKDVYTVDEQLMSTMRTYLQTLFNVLSTIVVISVVTPIFTLCLIPIVLYYAVEQAYFTVCILIGFGWSDLGFSHSLTFLAFTAHIPRAEASRLRQPKSHLCPAGRDCRRGGSNKSIWS